MLEYKKLKAKDVKIENLQVGDIFVVSGRKFSFVRIKRGWKNMIATDLLTGSDYNISLQLITSKEVIGKLKESKEKKAIKEKITKNTISLKDVKVGESVVIMTGRGNEVPQLYTLVEITKKAYSHSFKNPVTGKIQNFKGTDSWKVFRLNDLIKK